MFMSIKTSFWKDEWKEIASEIKNEEFQTFTPTTKSILDMQTWYVVMK